MSTFCKGSLQIPCLIRTMLNIVWIVGLKQAIYIEYMMADREKQPVASEYFRYCLINDLETLCTLLEFFLISLFFLSKTGHLDHLRYHKYFIRRISEMNF